jgi:hypothetical protein
MARIAAEAATRMKVNEGRNSSAPILVTGAHRSGTTWVGKMLAASQRVGYISEPLNLWHRPGVLRAPVRHWYTYICKENEDQFLPALLETIRFRYHLLAEVYSLRSIKDLLRMGRDASTFLTGRVRKQRPLLKDPFAVFSAPWFSERLGCAVVITVRHPAAFTSSLVRLNWSFDFRELLDQPLLMRDWLEPYRVEMETLIQHSDDLIGQCCILWKIIYTVVGQYKSQEPEFQIVRHEDLSLDPRGEFEKLCSALDIHVSPAMIETILESSSPHNPKEVSQKSIYSVQVDSQANLNNWKRRLTPDEINRVRNLTAGVSELYYSDEDWE